MRILALRGANLASLQDRFEVDLEKGLGGSGLFAITGPTGAGKSTLLDALGLALFDRTPRLGDRGGARVGRDEDEERLACRDVRGLLRRGAAWGFAEVDFEGTDGRRYRSTWEVKRAHGRTDGRLQEQTVTLVDLADGRVRGDHRKKATLAEIERLLGLTFEQFGRSVLLAQGDFAAFLKAGGSERADLLERMTGTEIYGRLSAAAHRRAAAEEAALAALEQEAAAVAVMAPEERAAAVQALEEARIAEGSASAAEAEARRAVDWHRALDDLRRAEAEGATALQALERDLAEQSPLRIELEAVAGVEPLRPLAEAVDRCAAEAAEAEAARGRARADREALSAAREGAARELAQAEEGLRAAFQRRDLEAPELVRARELDTRMVEARAVADRASLAAATAATAAREAGFAAAAGAGEVEAAEAVRQAAAGWLQDHAGLGELARRWERWREALDRWVRADQRARRAEERRPGGQEALEAASRALEEAEEAAADLRRSLAEAEAARQAAEEAEARLPQAALRQEREALEARFARLQALVQGRAEVARLAREEEAARGEAAAAAAEAGKLEGEAAGQAGLLQQIAAQLEEARRSRDLIVAAMGLEEQRCLLREGEPCPLCGSESHPWSLRGAPGAALHEQQESRLRALEEERAAATRARAASASLAAARRQAAGEAELRACRSAAEARSRVEALRRLAEPGLEGPPDRELEACEERRRWLAGREREAEDLAEAARRAREEQDRLRAARDLAEDAAARARAGVRSAEESLRAVERDLEAASREGRILEAELAEAFPHEPAWQAALRRDAAAFLAGCREGVEAWRARESARDGAARRLETLRPEAEGLRARAEAAAAEAALREAERRAAEAAWTALRDERAGVLEGRSVAAVEAETLRAVEQAEAALARARGAAEGARAAEEKAEGLLASALAHQARRQALLARAADNMAWALRDAGLEEEELRRRLARGAGWVERARQEVRRLDHALVEARARHRERVERREAHEGGDRPQGTRVEAEEALQSWQAEGAALRETRAALQARLAVDEEGQARRRGLETRLEEQRRTLEVWAGLRQVIGSADGKRFKVFAQSLTLDALLAEANRHLQDLAPRYQVERIPPPREATGRAADDHLEIQVVDRDMGDAVRGVQSLSGGETFLVSLALALGLSALAAERARIDSLFIDEGFGSLDEETLEVALSCLDSLQATGRQVGLISHVEGLAERVGAQVRVEPLGGGRSRVRVIAAGLPEAAAPAPLRPVRRARRAPAEAVTRGA